MKRNNRSGATFVEIGIAVAIFCILLLIALPQAMRLGKSEQEIQQTQQEAQQVAHQKVANQIVGKMTYIKDPRTEHCFVYFWDGSSLHGGPAFTCVPCESIPPELLAVAEIEFENKREE